MPPLASSPELPVCRSRVGTLPLLRGRSLVGMVSVSDFLYWIMGRA